MVVLIYCSAAGSDYKEPNIEAILGENEKMASSLLSLTSHFAQVQFRLKQIIEGPDETKSVGQKNSTLNVFLI